ncbi:aminotransferase class I/II-fold pyridoxal phosphate-dependent enzyme [Polyangium sp. 15x6]|uniref:trans-sulfuration enzyme family protein n=1 Tax=Polyangium sp. 15x6 TaxID=3042687 RepID=UPI00249B4A65|nr:aminotransferase class I/II-fold pyridoxal phosphate-dependent enzyme [Polyangium sp. 15x6]MDI3289476.1 aminotransferase class I/II-fold pyridoxal phosphate-dependent enzyme [Polyangium sp. 15x6]
MKTALPTSTDSVHAGERVDRPHHTLAPSIALTATYTFADSDDLERFMRGEDPDPGRLDYGRYGNPTVREVEARIAALDGTEDALLFPSGMAALTTTILAFVKAGDDVVLFRDTYRRTRQFVVKMLSRLGVSHTLLEPGDLDGLESAIGPKTRLVITEMPTNPYLRCVDVERLADICKKTRAKTLVDATFATPVNAMFSAVGIDLVVHSATKYLGGHNDVLGGSVSGPSSLLSLVHEARDVLGAVSDPHAAMLIGRGIKTLSLRVSRQNQTALAVARALEAHPAVERVYYPMLESHPDHAIAKKHLAGGGGVVSFVVRGGKDGARRVVDACKLARIAPSLGGVETLIEQPAIMSYSELGPEELVAVGIAPGLVRLAVGIEETEDVVADLVQALDATAGA